MNQNKQVNVAVSNASYYNSQLTNHRRRLRFDILPPAHGYVNVLTAFNEGWYMWSMYFIGCKSRYRGGGYLDFSRLCSIYKCTNSVTKINICATACIGAYRLSWIYSENIYSQFDSPSYLECTRSFTKENNHYTLTLSLIHISEPTRPY